MSLAGAPVTGRFDLRGFGNSSNRHLSRIVHGKAVFRTHMMLTCDHIDGSGRTGASVTLLSELTPEDTSEREVVRIALDDLEPSKYYAENIANLAGEIRLR